MTDGVKILRFSFFSPTLLLIVTDAGHVLLMGWGGLEPGNDALGGVQVHAGTGTVTGTTAVMGASARTQVGKWIRIASETSHVMDHVACTFNIEPPAPFPANEPCYSRPSCTRVRQVTPHTPELLDRSATVMRTPEFVQPDRVRHVEATQPTSSPEFSHVR